MSQWRHQSHTAKSSQTFLTVTRTEKFTVFSKRKKTKGSGNAEEDKIKEVPDFDDEDFGPLTEKVEKIQEKRT